MNLFANNGVKHGIILGIASILFSLVCYMIDPKMMLNGIAYLGVFITIYVMYRSAVEERRNNEGLLSFAEALKVTFLTYVIGSLFVSIFTYFMFNVFDPGLYEVAQEVAIDTAKFFAKIAGTEDQLGLMQDELESQNMQMSFSLIFLDFLVSLIFPGFVFSLVISAITKKIDA